MGEHLLKERRHLLVHIGGLIGGLEGTPTERETLSFGTHWGVDRRFGGNIC